MSSFRKERTRKRRKLTGDEALPVPEAVVDAREAKKGDGFEYRVKFVGHDNRSNRWLEASEVPPDLISAYHNKTQRMLVLEEIWEEDLLEESVPSPTPYSLKYPKPLSLSLSLSPVCN